MTAAYYVASFFSFDVKFVNLFVDDVIDLVYVAFKLFILSLLSSDNSVHVSFDLSVSLDCLFQVTFCNKFKLAQVLYLVFNW